MSTSTRRRTSRRIGVLAVPLLLMAVAAAPTPAISATASSESTGPATTPGTLPWETVRLQKINLPSTVKNAAAPAYSKDGKHLLFFANVVADPAQNPDPDRGPLHLWIVGADGKGARCLSCGTNEPLVGEAEQPGLIAPFPDGKRAFYGPYGDPRVLHCAPSLLDCRTATTYKIDTSGAVPPGGLIPPGGAVTTPSFDTGGATSPKLSPDGKYVAWSNFRTDSLLSMVIGKLEFAGDKYVVTDPRTLNPAGPTSPTDPDPRPWSDSTALFEFKSFADGGRSVVYVQVGGGASGNPDLWKLDLRTGERTRLTAYPEWEEDMAISPDGRSMYVGINSQRRHYFDWAGLMPFRGFFDASWVGAMAITQVSSSELRSCAQFASSLLPGDGDRGGKLVGQILAPYDGGDVRETSQLHGWPIWSPDSTSVALSTQSLTTLGSAPYLLVAHLDRAPGKPQPVVSSAPGPWAPTPQEYHGALGAKTTVTLKGLSSGTVTVKYTASMTATQPTESTATYNGYSDDGKSFVNGTQVVKRGGTTVRLLDDLTLRGEHIGSLKGDITMDLKARPFQISGSQTAAFDGTTVTGPQPLDERCANIREMLPRPTALDVRAQRSGKAVIVKVTSAYDGAGADEQGVDRRPVRGAKVTVGGDTAVTNRQGVAVLHPRVRQGAVDVDAGASFLPARVTLS
ncbi:TolB-like translocation protein [Streptomyces shenzhenensis]|uniref:PD40 domain-containing protein n=1 Tax=Streptomyces shenzhenensis TaxID=943815 RepID=UPI0015F0711A|nr:PD40 domain-containing protein [Streptomyces shenzhenensis]